MASPGTSAREWCRIAMRTVRRLVRRALRARSEAEVDSSELNIVPFLDILTTLTLFLLATSASVLAVSEVRAELPSFGPGRPGALGLSVTLTDRGAIMATHWARLGPDCAPTSLPTPTASVTQDGYDFAALAACARRVHDQSPTETNVVLSADPGVPYRDFVRAMDALRADGDVEMFPDVQVSAGIR
jgi:biopolymer transport protein ExbD